MTTTNQKELNKGDTLHWILTYTVLSGATIYGPGDETVGTVSHLPGSGAGTAAVIDVGGFLGLGARPVAIRTAEIDLMRRNRAQPGPSRNSRIRCWTTARCASARLAPAALAAANTAR
jgi:hypothetical protein